MIGDIVLSFYLGASQTRPSDLRILQPSRANTATMHSVTWQGFPFRFEVYYGIRLSYVSPNHPWTQFVLDYTHYKVYADTTRVVEQDGIWHGERFAQVAPMRDRVQSIEMTHGLNMLGVSVLQQVTGSSGGLYVGGGPVMFIPHTESRTDGVPDETGYVYGGAGFQVMAGAQACTGERPVFAEMKYSNGAPIVGIAQGHAQTAIRTVHEIAGVQFRHCARSATR
jgi:hypothetical protein